MEVVGAGTDTEEVEEEKDEEKDEETGGREEAAENVESTGCKDNCKGGEDVEDACDTTIFALASLVVRPSSSPTMSPTSLVTSASTIPPMLRNCIMMDEIRSGCPLGGLEDGWSREVGEEVANSAAGRRTSS